MTKKELWKIYTARNPTFDGEDEQVERVPSAGNVDLLKQTFGMK